MNPRTTGTVAAVVVTATFALVGCASQNAASPPPASISASAMGVSPRTNNFQMTAGPGVTTVGFSYGNSYSITTDQQQTWAGVQGCGPSNPCSAGRNGSTPVWQWFSASAPAFGCSVAAKWAGVSNMNFAFTGTLAIDGTTYPMTIGQAGFEPAAIEINVWFFAGSGRKPAGETTGGSAVTPDGKYVITGAASDDQVTVRVT